MDDEITGMSCIGMYTTTQKEVGGFNSILKTWFLHFEKELSFKTRINWVLSFRFWFR